MLFTTTAQNLVVAPQLKSSYRENLRFRSFYFSLLNVADTG